MKDRAMTLPAMPAFRFANLQPARFHTMVARGQYPAAPATRQGAARQFDLNDLVAAYCLGELLDRHVMAGAAGEIACSIQRELQRDHSAQTLSAWKVTDHGRNPHVVVSELSPSAGAVELFRFQTAAIRMRALEAIRAGLRNERPGCAATPRGQAGSEACLGNAAGPKTAKERQAARTTTTNRRGRHCAYRGDAKKC